MLNRYFSIYLGAHLVPAVIGFIAITAYTRLLNPAEYGVYVVGMSIAGIVGAVFFVWIRLSVSRYQASSADVDFRGTAMVAYGLTLAAMGCVAPAAILLLSPDVNVYLLVGGVFTALAVGAFDIAQEFARATLRPYRYAAIGITRAVLGLALGWLAIELGWGGLGLLCAVGLSFLIGAVLNAIDGKAPRISRYRRDQLMQFARYGLPLSLGGLSMALYSTSDRLVVAYLLGPDAAGKFGVAADLPRQFMVMLASSVAAATFPIVFRTFSGEGLAATRERLNENIELLLAVILPVAVWLALAADQVAGTLVGQDFRASVTLLLPIVALARVLGVINQFYLQISFQLAERPMLPVIQSIITLVLSITLMFPLVAAFDLLGAAYATLVTEAAGVVITIVLTRKAFVLPFEPRRLAGVLLASAVMGVAIYATRSAVGGTGLISLMTVSAAGGVAYAAAAWLLNVVRIRTSMSSFLRLRMAH
ncbi:lipopolysaccharide biosynthesis protein [Rhodopseudomonas palustris]|uniref:Polysaccharide biosynthesis protein n=1 Tax=Rhodopseudomonas palustris (strain BisB18) TaxID=316056 RepID=Q21BJ7_RHOPB